MNTEALGNKPVKSSNSTDLLRRFLCWEDSKELNSAGHAELAQKEAKKVIETSADKIIYEQTGEISNWWKALISSINPRD